MHKELAEYINTNCSSANATIDDSKNGDVVIYVEASQILAVCKALRTHSTHPFKALEVISGCDYEDRIEVSYSLATFDPSHNYGVLIKVKCPRENPELDSVVSIWDSANFQERECYDMLGVVFKNHPDLRRILCPDDWEGFPLRKDYKAAERYRHMTIYPDNKMNLPERGFEEVQKQDSSAKRPELNWD